jgi:hypothetical protein
MIQGFSGGLLRNTELFYLLDLPTFQRDFAQFKTLNHATGPNITFTRASDATFFDADGVLQTAANDTPRFDHDPATGASRGLLIEEQRTNSIRNSQAGGAVVGAPGTLPTHWLVVNSVGTSREVVGTGSENGMNYVDIRFTGTPANTNPNSVSFEGSTQVAALQNQTWTTSASVALVGGTLTNVTNVGIGFIEASSGGTALASGAITSFTPTTTLTRYVGTRTLTEASTAFYRPLVRFSPQNTVTAIDFTLRIAAPQLEQGAFATSYIPTTTAAATRAADSAIVTPVSSFYNEAEGTLFAEFLSGVDLSGPRVVQIDDEASSSIQIIAAASAGAGAYFFTNISGVNKATAPTSNPNLVANTIYKVAGSVSSAGVFASRDGETAAQSANGEYPTGLTRMIMGGSGVTALNGFIRKIAYWPKRLSNTLLEQLSTT